jgi:hypothetical protein
MDMNQATTFLGSSILLMIGMIVIIGGLVAINNILHKFWKPVNLFTPDSWKGFNPPVREELDRVTPTLDEGKQRGKSS